MYALAPTQTTNSKKKALQLGEDKTLIVNIL
jgi:hypothetical protein